ncbi:MAG: VCBS repeat-containing protein [Bacteroidetes bacterium]|nr:VCBS repeat-containing protein [Bacteroidota bacterium]
MSTMINSVKVFTALLAVLILIVACSRDESSIVNPIDSIDALKVDSLVFKDSTFSSVCLEWKSIGNYDHYDLRYSLDEINVDNWNLAERCLNVPSPNGFDELEVYCIDSLFQNTTYYIALQVVDSSGNRSLPSRNYIFTTKSLFVEESSYYTDYSIGPSSMLNVDLNNDGILDVVVTDIIADAILISHGNGGGEFSTTLSISDKIDPGYIDYGDINADGYVDLVVAHAKHDFLSILVNLGDGINFDKITYVNSVSEPRGVLVTDVNNDGLDDIVFSRSDSSGVLVIISKPNQEFDDPIFYYTGERPLNIISNDFNNDGFTDLAVCNYYSYNFCALFNNGNGEFNVKSYYGNGYLPENIKSADLDNDGDFDIVTSASPNISINFNEGDGEFSQVCSTIVNIGHPRRVHLADINGDSLIDILATNSDEPEFTVLLNLGNRRFSEPIKHSEVIHGTTQDICSGDYDNDGDIDLAIAMNGGRVFSVIYSRLMNDE